MDLFQENLVVTANNFNVTLVNQLWLVDNGIVLRDEFTEPMLFTPPLVQLATPSFRLLVIQNQVQFTPHGPEEQKQQMISERLGRFISLLPHTPYTAIGVNFTWHFRPPEVSAIASIGRRLFFKSDTPFARSMDSPDAKFGAYYSKDVIGFRLRLTIMPVVVPRADQPPEELFQLAFNYNLDTSSADEIVAAIKRWSNAKRHSESLVDEIEAAL